MFCEVCGIENEEGTVFCKNCGNKITIKEDKKYLEVVEQLKDEGFEILNDNAKKCKANDINADLNKSVLSKNNTNNFGRDINVERNNLTDNNSSYNEQYNRANLQKSQKVAIDRENQYNNYNANSKMGEVVVNSDAKRKSIVPIVICIVVLAVLIIGGIGGLTYYYLFGI